MNLKAEFESMISTGFLTQPPMRKTLQIALCGVAIAAAIGFDAALSPAESPAQPAPPSAMAAFDPEEPFLISRNGFAKLPANDEAVFHQIMRDATAQKLHRQSMGGVIQTIATQFLGAPYRENLLDRGRTETLVTNLREFDCVLFVESVLAMAQGVVKQDYTETSFTQHLQQQRYANAKVDYCDRFHYFSHWIEANQKQGVVQDLTPSLGGVPLNKTLNFMSQNWQKYPKLVQDAKYRDCIRAMEKSRAGIQLTYLPTADIARKYNALKPGDIVAIATDLPGLDVTHTGFVYRNPDGSVGLIHAAPGSGVKISRDLQTYTERVEHAIGILVARPQVKN